MFQQVVEQRRVPRVVFTARWITPLCGNSWRWPGESDIAPGDRTWSRQKKRPRDCSTHTAMGRPPKRARSWFSQLSRASGVRLHSPDSSFDAPETYKLQACFRSDQSIARKAAHSGSGIEDESVNKVRLQKQTEFATGQLVSTRKAYSRVLICFQTKSDDSFGKPGNSRLEALPEDITCLVSVFVVASGLQPRSSIADRFSTTAHGHDCENRPTHPNNASISVATSCLDGLNSRSPNAPRSGSRRSDPWSKIPIIWQMS